MMWNGQILIGVHNEVIKLKHILPVDGVEVVQPLVVPLTDERVNVQIQATLVVEYNLTSNVCCGTETPFHIIVH